MDLSDGRIRQILLDKVRDRVPAAGSTADGELLSLIDGFPGVLERWLHELPHFELKDDFDLRREAVNAQEYRYVEFDRLLGNLSPEERRMAMRIALPSLAEP
jgi:hypothetical protein